MFANHIGQPTRIVVYNRKPGAHVVKKLIRGGSIIKCRNIRQNLQTTVKARRDPGNLVLFAGKK
jgi:hypothetical protein